MGDSMSKTEKIKKRKRKLLGRIGIYALGAVVLGVIIWVLYYYIRFLSYDKYKEYLSDYEYEEGGEYSAISEKDPRVPGMELVAENDYLKLYTDPKTAIIAVYDKRNHSIVYSNPLNADDDPIANEANKRYLKSQFIINYFNKSRCGNI